MVVVFPAVHTDDHNAGCVIRTSCILPALWLECHAEVMNFEGSVVPCFFTRWRVIAYIRCALTPRRNQRFFQLVKQFSSIWVRNYDGLD